MVDLDKLREALNKAAEAASEAADKVGDGGTCNLDGVIIPTGKREVIKRRTADLDVLIRAFGGSAIDWGRAGRGYILNYSHGQANKRAVAAQAACKVLKEFGAYMHCQMD